MMLADARQAAQRVHSQLTTRTVRGAQLSTDDLVRHYLIAKRIVVDAGFDAEIAWQARVEVGNVTSSLFLRESAWVVLSAGMREAVIRLRFPLLAEALHDFEPYAVVRDPGARSAALEAFHHERKIDAILRIASVASCLGTRGLRRMLLNDPDALIQSLPFMGPATARHLAKNLGLDVAKPDRHLVRLADSTARCNPDELCGEIAAWIGDPIAVVDVVLWRWATLHRRDCSSARCDGLPHA